MADISVTLPDGSSRNLRQGATAYDLAVAIGPGLAKAALIAVVDGQEVDLNTPLSSGQQVDIVTADSEAGLCTLRHSTAHVLAQAVLELYPGATYAIGPPIADGFYYDFDLPHGASISDAELTGIEAKMREIIAADQPFQRYEVSAVDGLELFAEHRYKCEIIQTVALAHNDVSAARASEDQELASEVVADGQVSYYRNSESFIDLCRGPHVPSTGCLGHFKLMSVAGAYWRGDSGRPSLQRIYGTAWASRKDLDAHLHRLAEAEKRDHRRLARELDLVSWPTELGPGLAVWHPKGATVRRIIEDYSRHRHSESDYQFVFSPHLARSELWQTSGHLDFYEESMYPAMELDGVSYHPKPMNCPFHMLIYKSAQRSYRELPIRMFELGTVYRYELSGVVHGLMRSRGFTQDDSHIFVTREQAPAEIASLVSFVLSVLRAFGFSSFDARLSTRPLGKSVGEDGEWELATEALRKALEAAGLDYQVDEGGGAFYGPKIDIDVQDAIGRSWQLSTIQVDFQLPVRFDLEYVGADGGRHRPVIIHRALMGSIERFFGVLLEHYSGAFPAWLAPLQAAVLPVAAAHSDYAAQVVKCLSSDGFRAEVVEAQEPLGRRIRAAKLQKLPYVLVVGDEDVFNGTVGVNARDGDGVERGVSLQEFVVRLQQEVNSHK
ncbi:MAG: threonine--tRNA ligase [Acidimicrobiia bacterium]|nr:threonine--tRNA ligase [Acidimicrobiia bacterium]MYC57298.1 threonine--tRNA ligase [Acidimicrobiia bacterium]MYG94501.1 threonine--tRNA ligase [Acidimicrobiia bacterium]MYI30999.1 threonine--tRNA ligase [Acidimicrobiia bacterium]